MSSAFHQPQPFRFPRGREQFAGRREGNHAVDRAGDDQERVWRDAAYHGEWRRAVQTHAAEPVAEERAPYGSPPPGCVFAAGGSIQVVGWSGEDDGAHARIGRGELGGQVCAHGEPVHAEATAGNVASCGDVGDRRAERAPLGRAEAHAPGALAVPRPVEEQDAVAATHEGARHAEPLASIGAAAVRQHHGGAVAGGRVPTAYRAHAVDGERHGTQPERRRVVRDEDGAAPRTEDGKFAPGGADEAAGVAGRERAGGEQDGARQRGTAGDAGHGAGGGHVVGVPNFSYGAPHRHPDGPAAAGGHLVRLVGRRTTLRVTDADVPALLRRGGWSAHVARFAAGAPARFPADDAAAAGATRGDGAPGDPMPQLLVPNDPSLGGAAPRRIVAYLAGRYCAARALAAAGIAAPLPVGEAGAPAWPAGFVGSISHAPSRAVAVVARTDRWRAIGVDCEPVLTAAQADEIVGFTLPEAGDTEAGDTEVDATEVDATDVANATGDALTWPEFVTIGFSAKETLYKTLRPLVGAFFDFPDARLTRLDRAARRVHLVLTRDLAPGFARGAAFDVRFALADGHVHTCLALPRTPEPDAGGPPAPERAP